jgi:hypothetical protein
VLGFRSSLRKALLSLSKTLLRLQMEIPVTGRWTLDIELQKLTGTTSVAAALAKVGIITESSVDFTIERKRDWHRSGAETYSYVFSVNSAGDETDFILKACVAFSPVSTLDQILQSWIQKRSLLRDAGIGTPTLYAWGFGEILEEYIPYELCEVLKEAGDDLRESMLICLVEAAGCIASAGFAPIDAFSDMRSRGSDVVIIDFGEDLGASGVCSSNNIEIFDQLLKTFTRWGISISDALHSKLLSLFRGYSSVKRQS